MSGPRVQSLGVQGFSFVVAATWQAGVLNICLPRSFVMSLEDDSVFIYPATLKGPFVKWQ